MFVCRVPRNCIGPKGNTSEEDRQIALQCKRVRPQARLHPDRTLGCDRHHRGLSGDLVPRLREGKGSGEENSVLIEFTPNGSCDEALYVGL